MQAEQPPPPPRTPLTPPPAWPDATPTAVIPPAATVVALPVAEAGPAGSRNPLALWALLLGVAGVLTALVPFVGVVLGAVAIVLGFLAVARARATGAGPGTGIAGMVLGAVAAALGIILTIVMLLSFAVRGSADPGAESVPVPSASETPLAEPSPEASEPAPETTPTAAVPAPDPGAGDPDFVLDSRNDLVDVGKDLDDMIVTLDEGGFWRLLSNSVELSFNYGQLSARTAPATIADEWAAQLAVLDDQITEISDAIADERNDELRAVIAETQAQLVVLNGVLDKAGQ